MGSPHRTEREIPVPGKSPFRSPETEKLPVPRHGEFFIGLTASSINIMERPRHRPSFQ